MLLKSVLLIMLVLPCVFAAPIQSSEDNLRMKRKVSDDPHVFYGPCTGSCGMGIRHVYRVPCPEELNRCIVRNEKCKLQECPLTTQPPATVATIVTTEPDRKKIIPKSSTEPDSKEHSTLQQILQHLRSMSHGVVYIAVTVSIIILIVISGVVICCMSYKKCKMMKKNNDVEKQNGGDIPVPDAEELTHITVEKESAKDSSAK